MQDLTSTPILFSAHTPEPLAAMPAAPADTDRDTKPAITIELMSRPLWK